MKQLLTNCLLKAWYARHLTILTAVLLPFSYLFQSIVYLRRWLYQRGFLSSYKIPVPVIVVGNITVGGTGKTPCVIALAEHFKKEGYRVGIVSRGYLPGKQPQRLTPQRVTAHSKPEEVGDEPVLMATKTACPVIVGSNRVAAAQMLYQEYQCNLIISDDGLQHYALQRDVEIALVDQQRGFGNGYCLPAGPLREPKDRLKSVNYVILNQTDTETEVLTPIIPVPMQLEPVAFYALSDGEEVTLQEGETIHAVAGIGNPQRFFTTLRKRGLQVIEHVFPDHYAFQAENICFKDNYKVVMTEKDAIKCKRLAKDGYVYLEVRAKLTTEFLVDLVAQIRRIEL